MVERIRPFHQLPPEKLRSAQILLVGEEVFRCRNLPQLNRIIQEGQKTIVLMAEQELAEGSRGRAKAQILASIEGVEAVVACSEQELEQLMTGEFGSVKQFGEIILSKKKLLAPKEVFTEEVEVKQTSNPVDRQFMSEAQKLLSESTCWWRPTACLFVLNEEVIMTGASFNPWYTNCQELSVKPSEISLAPGEQISFCDAIHAEKVGIARAVKEGVSLEGSHLYVTTCPCEECSKAIIQAGVSRVVFDSEYYDRKGIQLLKQREVQVTKINKFVASR